MTPRALGFVLLFAVACDSAPPASVASAAPSATASAPLPAASLPRTVASETMPEPKAIGAMLILVAWKGAPGAPASITRSKADAEKRAHEALDKLRAGKTFAEVAKELTDDAPSRATGGAIGNVARNVLPQPVEDALFALKPGEISGVVEAPRGYYVIQRTP